MEEVLKRMITLRERIANAASWTEARPLLLELIDMEISERQERLDGLTSSFTKA